MLKPLVSAVAALAVFGGGAHAGLADSYQNQQNQRAQSNASCMSVRNRAQFYDYNGSQPISQRMHFTVSGNTFRTTRFISNGDCILGEPVTLDSGNSRTDYTIEGNYLVRYDASWVGEGVVRTIFGVRY